MQKTTWVSLVFYDLFGLFIIIYLVQNTNQNISDFMYVMIICSVVEVSYSYTFFFALFMVRWANVHERMIQTT